MRRKQPSLRRGYLRDWRDGFRDWVEAHPIKATALLTTLGIALGIGVLQEIANRIVDTEIAPWLSAVADVYRWVLIGLIVLLALLGALAWQQSLRIARLRVLSSDQSPAVTHKRMKDAEGQRALFGGYLNASMEVLETLTVYLTTVGWDGGDPDHIKKLLIPIVLRRVQRMYAHQLVPYASVYMPSSDNPDFLTIYANVNVNADRVQRNRWYIGSDKKRQRVESGTAGRVYLKQTPRVHHINPDTNLAEEGNDYIPSRAAGEVALYLSFVAMPLLDNGQCLGVLCLDSSARDTFDGDSKQTIIEPAAKLLTTILKLREKPT